jgi:hypothetical protein
VAKRKKRKSAGPPPVHNPRRAAQEAAGAAKPSAPRRKPGEPVPPSMRGILIRAGIIAAVFYPYLIYIVGSSPASALALTLIAFAIMIPLGLFLDRFRYKRQMRKWEERRAGQTGR